MQTPLWLVVARKVRNTSPELIVPGAQSAVSNVALAITGASLADADGNTQTVTLSVSHGTFSLAGTTGLSFTVGDGTADAAMTFSGSVSAVNTAIATLTYTSTTDYVGSDSLAISTNDGAGGTDSDSIAITVTWTPSSIGAALVGEFDITQNIYSDAGSDAAEVTDPIYRWTSLNDPSIYWERDVLNDRPTLQTVSGFNACSFVSGDILLLNGHSPLWNASGSTVSFWVHAGTSTGGAWYAESDNVNISPFLVIREGSTTKCNVFHRDDSGAAQINATSTANAFNSSWHHVCVTDNGGVCKTYIDGVLDNTAASYTKGTTTMDTISLGSSFRQAVIGITSISYVGRRVVLVSRVLTPEEVALLYAYG